MKKKTGLIGTIVLALAALFFAVYTQNSEEEISGSPAEAVPILGTSQPLESTALVESTRPENLEQETAETTQLSSFKGAEELPQTEQASLWTAFSEARREIRPLTARQMEMEENEGVSYFSSNPRNKLTTRFMNNGVKFESGYSGRDWEGTFSLMTVTEPAEIKQKGTRLEYVHDGILEWYDNRRDGIEQGFVVTDKTPEYTEHADGSLIVPVRVTGLKVEPLEEQKVGSTDLQLVNEAGDAVLSYTGLKAWDANGVMLSASMNPTTYGLKIVVADAGATYPIMIDPLVASLEQKLGPEVTGSGSAGEGFGGNISLDGDTASVGVSADDDVGTASGSAYVFFRVGTLWSLQQKVYASDGTNEMYFGTSVAVSGDTLLIGAHESQVGNGSAYVFTRTGGIWSQQQKLVASDGALGDNFGLAVALDSDTAIVGAILDDDNGSSSGSAYVFTRSGSVWSQEQKLVASDGAEFDYFGGSVALSGDTALIGAYRDNDNGGLSGSAYVFSRSGTIWTEQQKLTASDAAGSDNFGYSVSLSGDTALVGAHNNYETGIHSGTAYVFVRSGTVWSEEQKIVAGDPAVDGFGRSVSLSGNTALIGALWDDPNGVNSGSAIVFTRSGSVWSLQQKITASDGADFDLFGNAVCLSGDTALVGSFYDDDNGVNSGSAYVFTRSGTTWSEQQKIDIGDAASGYQFGQAVSLFGDTALIGAYRDVDLGESSGSAYVFTRSGTVWSQQQKLIANDGDEDDYFGYSVSLYSDTALIGAYQDEDDGYASGSAYVFTRSGTVWIQQDKLTAADAAGGDYFGYSVSVSGDTALVGAYRDDAAGSFSGSAYVFVRGGALWSEQAKLTAGDGAASDVFGYSVSVSGDTALVGAYNDDDGGSSSGSAYVFVRSGTSWGEQAKLTAGDADAGDKFGSSVSLSGDTALIGAYDDDAVAYRAGSAYVFVRSGLVWSEQAKLIADDGAAYDQFGKAVSLSGNTAVIGVYNDDDGGSSSGSAYVFTRSATTWSQQTKLVADDGAEADYFGKAVSVDGDTVLVGADGYDGVDTYGALSADQGSVYIYRLTVPPGEIGVGAPSGVLLDGSSETFGNQAVGIGKVLFFKINSEGGASLTGLGITKDGADAAAFVVGSLDTTSLAPGLSTTFRVTFTPASDSAHSAAIHITSNDADESPFDINLTGTGLANTDSDPGSDAWEAANGFSPTTDGDVMSLDSDGDGSSDIMEIYQGTERYPAIPESAFAVMALGEEEDGNGFSDISTSNGVLKVRYRRSTTQTAVAAQGIWQSDLTDSSWLYSGESSSGTVVTVTENVVSNGIDFEVVESASEVTSGDTGTLFFTLELSPNE